MKYLFRFHMKNGTGITMRGDAYYPVEFSAEASPCATVLANVFEGEEVKGQINQTEILAWWREPIADASNESLVAHV